jgi:hypothetical protein
VVINGNYNKQRATASTLQRQHGNSGTNTDGVTMVLSIHHATLSTKQKQHNLHNHVILHVQLLRRSKNKKTVHIPMFMILHAITAD